MSITKILLAALGGVVAAVIGVGICLLTLDFDDYKIVAQDAAKNATGRGLVIAGDLDLQLSWSPKLRVEGVSLTNADWGSRPEMIKLGALEVVLNLAPLLSGTIEVAQIELSNVDVLLETDKAGLGNWVFKPDHVGGDKGAGHGDDDGVPLVRDVRLRNIRVTHKDGVTGETCEAVLQSLDLSAPGLGMPVQIALAAELDGQAINLTGDLPAINAVFEPGLALPFSVKVDGFGLKVAAGGSAKLRRDGKVVAGVAIDGLSLTANGSDFAGTVDLNLTGNRPYLKADLSGKLLDLTTLTPASSGDAPKAAGDPLDQPIDLAALGALNADIKLTLGELRQTPVVVKDIALTVKLKNKVLKIDPASAVFGGGKIAGAMSLDGSKGPARVSLKSDWSGADFGLLAKQFAATDLLAAKGNASSRLSGRGETPRQIYGLA